MVAVMIAFGLILLVSDYGYSVGSFNGILKRNSPGDGSYTEELMLSSEYYEGEYSVEVDEQQFTEEQAKELFKLAEDEIAEEFLGENEDGDHIWTDINLATSYQDGTVSAVWTFDSYKVVQSDGTIKNEDLDEECIVTATVTLTCGSYEEVYVFSFCVIPLDSASQDGFLYRLQLEIDSNDAEEAELILPDSVDGIEVTWSRQMSYRGLGLIALALITIFAIPMANKNEKRRAESLRRQELLIDYPKLLGQLTLLLRVGIAFPEASLRIAKRYEEQKRKDGEERPGFELMLRLSREMRDGIGEIQALDHMARDAKIKEYRKLVLLLQQNQKKGNQHVIEQLEKEEIEAFEMRKAFAKKAGEEASTKLLLPMIGVLGMLMLILIIPVFMTMGAS